MMDKNVQVINEVFGFDGSIYDVPEDKIKNEPKQDKSKNERKD